MEGSTNNASTQENFISPSTMLFCCKDCDYTLASPTLLLVYSHLIFLIKHKLSILDPLLNSFARAIVPSVCRHHHIIPLLQSLHWLTITKRIFLRWLLLLSRLTTSTTISLLSPSPSSSICMSISK